MTKDNTYVPPKVWQWDMESGGAFAKVNRPISGKTHDEDLPVGKHPLQLYSQGTPNGVKVTILLEEMLSVGDERAEYDAWLLRINGRQFGSGFVDINPNSKIPALLDCSFRFTENLKFDETSLFNPSESWDLGQMFRNQYVQQYTIMTRE